MSITTIAAGKPVLLSQGSGTLNVTFSCRSSAEIALVCLHQMGDTGDVVEGREPYPSRGALWRWPFIELLHEDAADAVKGKLQTLQINLAHAFMLGELVVFAYACDEDVTWSSVRNAAVNIGHPSMGHYDFRLHDNYIGPSGRKRRTARSRALLSIKVVDNDTLKLTPLGAYFTGTHQQVATAFGMNIRPAPAVRNDASWHL